MSLRLDECLCTTLCLVCDLDSTVSLVRRVDRNALWCNTLDFRLVLVVIFPIQDRWSHSSRLSLVASHPHRPRLLVASPRPNRLSLASSSFSSSSSSSGGAISARRRQTPPRSSFYNPPPFVRVWPLLSHSNRTRRRPNRRRTLNVPRRRRLPNNNNNNTPLAPDGHLLCNFATPSNVSACPSNRA